MVEGNDVDPFRKLKLSKSLLEQARLFRPLHRCRGSELIIMSGVCGGDLNLGVEVVWEKPSCVRSSLREVICV